MLNQLAALGIGLVSAVTSTVAVAHENCDPAHQSATAPSYAPQSYAPPGYAPQSYGPAPAPVPTYAPAPAYAPAPPPIEADYALELRGADYDRNGWVTRNEAEAYGQAAFAHADLDRNGVLTRRELWGTQDALARSTPSRDGVVTFAAYEANVDRQFYELDRNRDGYLSGYELGARPAERPTASVSWRFRWPF
jgi:hypothetical protein